MHDVGAFRRHLEETAVAEVIAVRDDDDRARVGVDIGKAKTPVARRTIDLGASLPVVLEAEDVDVRNDGAVLVRDLQRDRERSRIRRCVLDDQLHVPRAPREEALRATCLHEHLVARSARPEQDESAAGTGDGGLGVAGAEDGHHPNTRPRSAAAVDDRPADRVFWRDRGDDAASMGGAPSPAAGTGGQLPPNASVEGFAGTGRRANGQYGQEPT